MPLEEARVRPARGPLLWVLRWRKVWGITLPPFGVFIRPDILSGDVARLRDLLQHEQMHWQQYLRAGLFVFYTDYLYYSQRHGYWNNPMEVEAREAEKAP